MKKSAIFLTLIAAATCFAGYKADQAIQTTEQNIEIVSALNGAQTAQGMPRVILKNRHGKPV